MSTQRKRRPPIDQLEQAFKTYLRVYFENRDLEATIELLSPDNTGFGTGLDERGDSFDQSVQLYTRDIQQAPQPIGYTIHWFQTQLISPTLGLVRAELDLVTQILNQEVNLNHLRMSLIFVKDQIDCWKLLHHHTSLPSQAHGDHESFPIKELEDRTKVLVRLVKERTKELEEANSALEKMAVTDALTGLGNRKNADDFLRQEIARIQRYDTDLSVILFDIDHFKHLNDTKGHNLGDEVLKQVGKMVSSILRSTDLAARWGGDEFLILCPQVKLTEALELSERIRTSISSLVIAPDLQLTASLGVTEALAGDSSESLIERADRALYDAKHRGRNTVSSR